MKILITGATGFIGKNLIARMMDEHELHLLVRPDSNISGIGVDNIYIFTDDIQELSNYLKDKAIDGIIHLASLYITEHKSEQVKDIVLSNIYFGTALLEACKLANTKWFLNTGTIWQNYNTPDYSDLYNPVNLYAASKQAFITMARFYSETTPIRFCTLKLCDTYGENDTRKKIFTLFGQIAKSGELLNMSPGEQKLDILHISDVVDGFAHLATLLNDRKNSRNEYVLSCGYQRSLKEWARLYEERNKVTLNINWGGREYRQREVMKPYIGNILEGWNPKKSF